MAIILRILCCIGGAGGLRALRVELGSRGQILGRTCMPVVCLWGWVGGVCWGLPVMITVPLGRRVWGRVLAVVSLSWHRAAVRVLRSGVGLVVSWTWTSGVYVRIRFRGGGRALGW